MKLLEFAIHQKLERDNDLLDYVAKNKAVPCSVLEDGLESLIAPLLDDRASLLLDDYAQMLQTYVPVTYQKGEGSTYCVQGSVPDTILDSIKLVHNVNANDAISAMIAANEKTLQQHSTISNVELLQNTQRLLSTPMASLRQEVKTKEVLPMPLPHNAEVVDTLDIEQEVSSTQQLREQLSEVERVQQEARDSMQQVESDMNTITAFPSVEEATQSRETIDTNTVQLRDKLRDIYEALICDIQQAGLDTALGLQL